MTNLIDSAAQQGSEVATGAGVGGLAYWVGIFVGAYFISEGAAWLLRRFARLNRVPSFLVAQLLLVVTGLVVGAFFRERQLVYQVVALFVMFLPRLIGAMRRTRRDAAQAAIAGEAKPAAG